MTLQQLYYFQTIAATQHYRLAAEKLNVAQPTLSRSISNLEEELGLYLFEKSGRNVVLTKCGNVFLDHVNVILKDVTTTTEKMNQLVSSEAGHIDIGYVSPLATSYIPKLVRNFQQVKNNHKITFSLKQNATPKLIAGLKTNEFDVVFGSYVDHEPDLVFTAAFNQEMVAIVCPSHELAKETSVPLSVFHDYPVISYDTSSSLGKYTRSLFEENSIIPLSSCEASDEYAISALVEQDFGIALVADCRAIHQADVKILPLRDINCEHTVYMIYNRNRYQIPAVKNFIKYAVSSEAKQISAF